jgi:hypothetical protein
MNRSCTDVFTAAHRCIDRGFMPRLVKRPS